MDRALKDRSLEDRALEDRALEDDQMACVHTALTVLPITDGHSAAVTALRQQQSAAA
jgi:hypothetical protein